MSATRCIVMHLLSYLLMYLYISYLSVKEERDADDKGMTAIAT
jgi:hypothetical protein